jgi:hypothetical protein
MIGKSLRFGRIWSILLRCFTSIGSSITSRDWLVDLVREALIVSITG